MVLDRFINFSEEILCSLSDTAVILRKDQCTAKTILHLLQYFDCDKFEDVTELCDDDQLNIYSQYDNTCQFNVVKMFLRDVANATIRKNVEKLPESLELVVRKFLLFVKISSIINQISSIN